MSLHTLAHIPAQPLDCSLDSLRRMMDRRDFGLIADHCLLSNLGVATMFGHSSLSDWGIPHIECLLDRVGRAH